jgi:hypothetical protein
MAASVSDPHPLHEAPALKVEGQLKGRFGFFGVAAKDNPRGRTVRRLPSPSSKSIGRDEEAVALQFNDLYGACGFDGLRHGNSKSLGNFCRRFDWALIEIKLAIYFFAGIPAFPGRLWSGLQPGDVRGSAAEIAAICC